MNIQSRNHGFVTVLVLIMVMMISMMGVLVMRSAFLTQAGARDVLSCFHVRAHAHALKTCCARLCICLERHNRLPGSYTFICDQWPWVKDKKVRATIMCVKESKGRCITHISLDDQEERLAAFKGKIELFFPERAFIREWRVI